MIFGVPVSSFDLLVPRTNFNLQTCPAHPHFFILICLAASMFVRSFSFIMVNLIWFFFFIPNMDLSSAFCAILIFFIHVSFVVHVSHPYCYASRPSYPVQRTNELLWLNFHYFISKRQHSYTTTTQHYKNTLKLHYHFNNQIANKSYSKLSWSSVLMVEAPVYIPGLIAICHWYLLISSFTPAYLNRRISLGLSLSFFSFPERSPLSRRVQA